MKKVILIGCGGSGKSTLAKRIGQSKKLPVVHLDALYWKPGWIEPSKDEWRETIEKLMLQDAWVMDGNYGGTLDLRLADADTVIFFDLPRVLCIWRVIKRRILFHNKTRTDMGEDCPEKLDMAFLKWIWTYQDSRREKTLEKLKAVEANKRVIILNSLAAVKSFENTLNETQRSQA
jgi:adenylate kinase family enzyme